MPQQIVNSLSELLEKLDGLRGGDNVYILFTGSKDSSGKSWCPDCNDAEPVIQKALPNMPEESEFICCIVGDRPTWKNPENEFRKHPEFKLTGIPTLMKWKTNSYEQLELMSHLDIQIQENKANRLGPDDCKKQTLVDMIFE